MKEFLSKYKLHVLVAVVGIVGLLWLNGTLKGCDVESLSVNSDSTTSEATQPAFTPAATATPESATSGSTVLNTEDEPTPASKNAVTKEGTEN